MRTIVSKEISISVRSSQSLAQEISHLIKQAHNRFFSTANQELVLLNWNIEKKIKTEIIKNSRADYGEEIVATLSQQLQRDFGRGYTRSALSRMIKFYDEFPDEKIVATLSQQLGWSHFVELIPITDPLKREFYAEICRIERWSVRILRERIQNMLFERTAISRKPELTIRNDLDELRSTGKLSKELVLRDPYILEFLGLGTLIAKEI
jgi:hypothetical protein